MSERVPVLVLVDDGYFGHETLHEELGPAFDVRFASGPLHIHTAMLELVCPVVLAPRILEPIPGDVMLADLERQRFAFVGALLLDEDGIERLDGGVHIIVRRPLRQGALRLHMQAAAAQRQRLIEAKLQGERLAEDFAHLRDGFRHDLRGQLQTVVGLAALALEIERPHRPPDDELIDFISRIAAAGDRLTRFVDALADWLNVARRPLERAVVDLGELCLEVIAKARAHESGDVAIAIEPADPTTLGARVSADPRMLQRALEVLVERSLSTSKSVRLRLFQGDGAWSIAVFDECPKAIPAAQCERAFTLFERVAGGDGIGLALVHKVAERHGASVSLEAVPTGGHEVVLTWPWGA